MRGSRIRMFALALCLSVCLAALAVPTLAADETLDALEEVRGIAGERLLEKTGGIVQGIGHTLFEDIQFDHRGRPIGSSFMQYKIPTRLDMGRLTAEFEHSYEPTGPFGAKSIGEIVINTPAPAIAHAIARATGVWHRELPITPEKVAMSVAAQTMG